MDLDLSGAHLGQANLSQAILWRVNLTKANLNDADLSDTNLQGANFSEANLSGTNLSRADLEKTIFLKALMDRSNLSEANLWRADLSEAILSETNFTKTNLNGAKLVKADLTLASLLGASLRRANLEDANLFGADLSGANLRMANLSGTDIGEVSFTTDELFNRLRKWWGPISLLRMPLINRYKKWVPVGITDFLFVDCSKINSSRNPVLKRHMEDYQFIQGFKNKSWFHRWVFYQLWKITSDCGRSLLVWLLWSAAFIGFFTFLYSRNLNWFAQARLDWFNVLYFSVITFTTLGFGDISPHLQNRSAQGWVMIEVIIGYIMLGGLISILANKLARRA